jgi:hypothetical protein
MAPSVTCPRVELHEIQSVLEWKARHTRAAGQRINEAAVSIRNELANMQWMQSLGVRL